MHRVCVCVCRVTGELLTSLPLPSPVSSCTVQLIHMYVCMHVHCTVKPYTCIYFLNLDKDIIMIVIDLGAQ